MTSLELTIQSSFRRGILADVWQERSLGKEGVCLMMGDGAKLGRKLYRLKCKC